MTFPMSSRTISASAVVSLLLTFASVNASGQTSNPLPKPAPAIEGYVTAVHPPGGFDVNGTPVATTPTTTWQVVSSKGVNNDAANIGALRVGTYVEVIGANISATITADSVHILKDQDAAIKGFGVIEKVISSGPTPVYQADGYRIHITEFTVTAFSGSLKTLADVGANTWLQYEGQRDASGMLAASRVTFFPAKRGKVKAPQPVPSTPTRDSLIDADGNFLDLRTKVRYANSGGPCGWHRFPADAALQSRVSRIGFSVIPAYQKQLADDQPAKIHFRFYAVDETRFREDLGCNVGLILIPKQVIDRLTNDDELAAVLADGVAANLQWQSARLAAEFKELLGAEIAGDIIGAFVPGGDLGSDVGVGLVERKVLIHMQEQRGRIALALMADAGYDPWQAPEAWRLLAPKRLPKDVATARYPNRSGYQLGILNLQYTPVRASAEGSAPSQGAQTAR
jgi:hypothetical protein